MLKLLIVDDEPEIVDGIYYLINENDNWELNIVKSYSGVEAFEYLKENRIDIVLSDIRMPILDGFQLREKVLALWPDTEFVFLSGYDEFDYVYKAIKSDNVKYLLKTEEEHVIIETVRGVINKIEERKQSGELLKEAEEQMEKARPFIIKEFLKKIVDGRKFSDAYISERFKELKIPLSTDKNLFILLVKLEKNHLRDYPELHMFLDELLARYLRGRAETASYNFDNKIIWFIQNNASEDCYNYVKGYLEKIQESYRSHFRTSASFFLGRKSIGFSSIPEEFDELSLIMNSLTSTSKEVLFLNINRHEKINNSSREILNLSTLARMIEEISDALDQRELESFDKACSLFLKELKKESCTNPLLYHEITQRYSQVFISFINRFAHEVSREERSRIMDGQNDWDKIEKFYPDLGRNMCRSSNKKKEADEINLIERIEKYIRDNISRDISLTCLSDEFYFNASYLSRFYSRNRGRKLSEYIKNTRLEKARELLRDPDIQIQDVGMAIGIDSAAYFTSFFKKHMGISPREYRLNSPG